MRTTNYLARVWRVGITFHGWAFPVVTLFLVGGLTLGLVVVFQDIMLALLVVVAVPYLILLILSPKIIVFGLLIFACLVRVLVTDFGVPALASYVLDGLLVLALLASIHVERRTNPVPPLKWGLVGIVFVLFVWSAVLSATLHPQSGVLQLWAIRSFFRFFLFFYVCVRFLDRRDLRKIERFSTAVLVTNVFYCSYQFFVLELPSGDYINGVFGSEVGGNAALNAFNVAITAYFLFGLAYSKKSLRSTILVIAACAYIAAISELKIYYLELVILVALSVFVRRPSLKMSLLVIASLLGIRIGVTWLGRIYPGFANFFSIEQMAAYASYGYSNDVMLGRTSGIQQLNELFLRSPLDSIFGLGLGAGQYSQFFSSPLYEMHGEVLRWSWFSAPALFLELGFLGLTLYIAFFLSIVGHCWSRKYRRGGDGWIFGYGGAMAVMAIVQIFYNSSLTVEPSCYLLALSLALPFIVQKDSLSEIVSVSQPEQSNAASSHYSVG